MVDPSLYSLSSLAIEQAINTALRYDPGTRSQLSSITGNILQITISDADVGIQLHIENDEIRVVLNTQDAIELDADVTLKGQGSKLIELALNQKHSLANSGVEVSGNLATLETLQTILKQLDIDWQDALAEHLHPAAADVLSSVIQKAITIGRHQINNITENTEDYLSNELRLIPHALEIESFKNDVNSLRMNTERLAAKISHLQAKLAPTHTKST